MKTAVISGIFGQMASHMAELLLSKRYKVIGFHRRTTHLGNDNIKHLLDNPNLIIEQGDLTDYGSISRIVGQYKPDEFYNYGAMSFVGASWDQPIATCNANFIGVANCLEAIRLQSPKTKFFTSSTSEIYGAVSTPTQNEESTANPLSPYGASKYASEALVKVYRKSYGIFACFSRNFNCEGSRRGKEFVTRKITSWIGELDKKILFDRHGHSFDFPKRSREYIDKGIVEPLHLGNLEAKRDWGSAVDVVRGNYLMLGLQEPDDFCFGSGKNHSIKDFLTKAFGFMGIEDWSDYVVVNPKFYRPADVNTLCCDYSKANRILGWQPLVSFDDLVKEMLEHDLSSMFLETVFNNGV